MEIFTKEFLKPYLETFSKSRVVGFEGKKDIIGRWASANDVGKTAKAKEESIKSRFMAEIFDEVLGYKYHNTDCWLIEEELKSAIDGTKPDAAFGIHLLRQDKNISDVRMVAEFKDSKTDFDKPQQRRKVKISPVDQAFLYASKMPGDCRWVVVCSPAEIRFYHYSSQSRCQKYLLKDLCDGEMLKELIFLFGSEHLISRKGESKTDRLFWLSKVKGNNGDKVPQHIIDQLFQSIRRFDSINFVDPDFVSDLYPFNIFPEKVYHYNEGTLLTLNPDIYRLLEGVNIVDGEIVFSAKLVEELGQESVNGFKSKLFNVFKRLNECLIFHILAIEDYQHVVALNQKQRTIGFSVHFMAGFHPDHGILKDIRVLRQEDCDCYICNYRSMDFAKLIQKVRSPDFGELLLDKAFGHYLIRSTNNDESYDSLIDSRAKLKGRGDRIPEYFLTLYNLKFSKNFFVYKRFGNANHIIANLKAIDLDEVLATEVDIFVDPDVRRYLIEIKEETLIWRSESRVEEIHGKLKNTRKLLAGKYNSYSGSDYLSELEHISLKLYSHFYINRIMGDMFSGIERLYKKIFSCYLESYQTKGFGLQTFSELIILDAIFHIQASPFTKYLEDIKSIELEPTCKKQLLVCAENILSSYITEGTFGVLKSDVMEIQTKNPWFNTHYWNVFSNLFSVLSNVELDSNEIGRVSKLIVDLICLNVGFAWYRVTSMTKFLERNAKSFSTDQLKAIIGFCSQNIRPNNHRYDELLRATCFAWENSREGLRFDDERAIKIAVANTGDGGMQEYLRFTYFWLIASEGLREIIIAEIERYLEAKFSVSLYQELLHREVIRYDYKDYFVNYVEGIKESRSPNGFWRSLDSERPVRDFTVLGLACVIHRFKIDSDHKALSMLDNLTDFESWLLNPRKFDYVNFDLEWLEDVNQPVILDQLKDIPALKNLVENSLVSNYNGKLASIYFRYLNNQN